MFWSPLRGRENRKTISKKTCGAGDLANGSMNQVQALAWYTRAAKGQQGLKEAAACAQRLSDSLEHSKRARLQPQVMLYQQATTLRTSLCSSSAPRKLSIGQLEFEMCILDTHQLDIFCLPMVNWLGVGGVHVSTLVGRNERWAKRRKGLRVGR